MWNRTLASALATALVGATFAQSPEIAVGHDRLDGTIASRILQTDGETIPPGANRIIEAPPAPLDLELARRIAADGAFELDAVSPAEFDDVIRRFESTAWVRPGPARVGFVRRLGEPIGFPGPWTHVEPLPDGRTVWLLALRSPEAREIRPHLSDVNLGNGTMIVYSLSDRGAVVRGPFRNRGPNRSGDFWPASVPGDTLVIEVVGDAPPAFTVREIAHRDVDNGAEGDGTRGDPLQCHSDVNCFRSSVNDTAREATGRMQYIRDGILKACTGTLLADLDPETFVPYFLTANHCVDETVDLSTLEVLWNFEVFPCQLDNCPNRACLESPNTDGPTSVNATLLATSGATVGNDATVLRLHGALAEGASLAGWDADNDHEELGEYCVHHPAGSWKRVVFGLYHSTPCSLECGCFTPINYTFFSNYDGWVEPGSSGSAMFTPAGRVIGQLFGTCSLCPEAFDCFEDQCMQFGEFAETFPDVEYWLNLGGTLWVDAANITPPHNGLLTDPYRTVGQANTAAWDGVQIKIRAGTYSETTIIDKQLTLRAVGGVARIGG